MCLLQRLGLLLVALPLSVGASLEQITVVALGEQHGATSLLDHGALTSLFVPWPRHGPGMLRVDSGRRSGSSRIACVVERGEYTIGIKIVQLSAFYQVVIRLNA
jgi:hypothetical protein